MELGEQPSRLVGQAQVGEQLVDPGVVVAQAEVAGLDLQHFARGEEWVEHQLLRHYAEHAARRRVEDADLPSQSDDDQSCGETRDDLAGKSALTLRIGKEAFYRQLDMGLENAYAYCSEVMTRNMMAEDAKEGIGAFLEKRKPNWAP